MKKLFLSFLFLLTAIAVPAAFAQTADLGVLMHFDRATAIPGQMLPAGTYKFVADDSSPDIIRVTEAKSGKFVANLETITASRLEPADKFKVTVGEGRDGKPALMSWFDAGETSGYELVYPKQDEKQLRATAKTIDAGDLANSTASGD
jgi:hypothetical protein